MTFKIKMIKNLNEIDIVDYSLNLLVKYLTPFPSLPIFNEYFDIIFFFTLSVSQILWIVTS